MPSTPSPTTNTLSFRQIIGLTMGISAVFVLILLPWIQPGQGTNIPRFFIFLGRFHPLILHLPIGWILLAVMLEAQRLPILCDWMPPSSSSLKSFIMMLGAVSSFIAVILGWMLSFSGGYDADLLQRHFTFGLLTAIGANLCFICRLLPLPRMEAIAYPLLLLATVGMLTLAGHLGASITHGSDYLTEYAPAPVRELLGFPVIVPHEIPEEVDDRQAFEDVVKPILTTSCLTCHSGEKFNGGLRLDTYAGLMKGGSDGPVVNTATPDVSELLHRINLPASEEKHMPPAGHPALNSDQIAVLSWWVKAGAPEKQTVAELKTPPEIIHILTSQTPLPAPGSAAASVLPKADSQEASATGENVTPISGGSVSHLPEIPGRLDEIVPNGPDLEYTAGFQFAQIDDEQFDKLAPVAEHVIWLNLARTHISNKGLELLPKMAHLQKLELQDTKIGDSALASIAQVKSLEVLNLNGTQITEQGLPKLASLQQLKRLYLYNTAITEMGVKNLKSQLPKLEIVRQLPPVNFPAPTGTPPAPAPVEAMIPAKPTLAPPAKP